MWCSHVSSKLCILSCLWNSILSVTDEVLTDQNDNSLLWVYWIFYTDKNDVCFLISFLISVKQFIAMVETFLGCLLSEVNVFIKFLNKQVYFRGCCTFLAACSWNIWVCELPHMVPGEYIYTITHNKLNKIHMCICQSLSHQLVLDCYVLALLNSNTVVGSVLSMTCSWLGKCKNILMIGKESCLNLEKEAQKITTT